MMNSATRLAVLAAMIAAGAPFHTITIGLYNTLVAFSPDNVLATFTAVEANYTGYARSAAVVWGTAYLDAAKTAITQGDNKLFVCGDAAAPQDIFGEFWVGGGLLQRQVIYDSPQPMRDANDYILSQPSLSFTG
jgi:hypothetical protein